MSVLGLWLLRNSHTSLNTFRCRLCIFQSFINRDVPNQCCRNHLSHLISDGGECGNHNALNTGVGHGLLRWMQWVGGHNRFIRKLCKRSGGKVLRLFVCRLPRSWRYCSPTICLCHQSNVVLRRCPLDELECSF